MAVPILLSTWKFGSLANRAGWPVLTAENGSSLDAVELACRAVEASPEVNSVGYGGYPDATGQVTLDAAVMLSPAQCGAVCSVRGVLHPVSLARIVMERTPHMLIAGCGAERLARRHGLAGHFLLTDKAQNAWHNWVVNLLASKENDRLVPPASMAAEAGDKHGPTHSCGDTVAVIARDRSGRLAAACSTSGLAFKLPGRVGDSPIVGHALYVDPNYGAAVATGHGELAMGVCASFLAVEQLRQARPPVEAGAEVLRRIAAHFPLAEKEQMALIILASGGAWSSVALRPGFCTAVCDPDRNELVEPEYVMFPG